MEHTETNMRTNKPANQNKITSQVQGLSATAIYLQLMPIVFEHKSTSRAKSQDYNHLEDSLPDCMTARLAGTTVACNCRAHQVRRFLLHYFCLFEQLRPGHVSELEARPLRVPGVRSRSSRA